MFDNPLEIKDEIYIITEVEHNQLYRSVKKKIPYFNATDKEFYTKNIFKRKIQSLTQGFTNDSNTIADAYGSFNSQFGQTPLYSAVFESAISALDELRDEEFDAKFIVLLTDGVDNFSEVTKNDSIEKVHSIDGYQKTHIYPILLKDIYGSAKSSLFDFAVETDSYTQELMMLEIGANINEILDNILGYEYKDISSTIRGFTKDFKEVIKMEQFDVSITIPSGFKLYIQARANEESDSTNSSDWSNWTTEQQLISGDNTITFSEVLFGRYFEFRLIATPSGV
jgi:hypothetical protein